MPVKGILLLGNPKLHQTCDGVSREDVKALEKVVTDLHDTLMDFRKRWGAGRAIAAPQIGVTKRLVYMNIHTPTVFINPIITNKSSEIMGLWDDCMSFPELLVKVRRHARCTIRFRDPEWDERRMDLDGDLSELLQHECDHLDGILAVTRAIDGKSFGMRSQRELFDPAD